jgi:hypothetical protein
MNKRIYYTIATAKYENDFQQLLKSFTKYHPNDQLVRFAEESVPNVPAFFYRATPYFAKKLFDEGYTEICHLDADQIILGNLDEIWEGDYDVATVLNDPSYPIKVWDCQQYFNNGLNVFKSPDFINHWNRLCYTPHFNNYQFREQDLLTILASDYFNYKVKVLDFDKIYGEFAKPVWKDAKVEGDKIMIADKQLMVIHFGGGAGNPSKGNFRIRFQPEVSKFIEGILK